MPGSFFGARSPRPFLEALRTVLDRRPELRGRVRARFLGDLRPEDREWAGQLGIDGAWEEDGFVPHRDSLAAQRLGGRTAAPDPPRRRPRRHRASRARCSSTSPRDARSWRRSRPDGVAANLLRSVGAGEVADSDDVDGIAQALERLIERWVAGGLHDISYPEDVRDRLSRQSRARDLAVVLTGVSA